MCIRFTGLLTRQRTNVRGNFAKSGENEGLEEQSHRHGISMCRSGGQQGKSLPRLSASASSSFQAPGMCRMETSMLCNLWNLKKAARIGQRPREVDNDYNALK